MRIGFVTLFPEMIREALGHSIIGRAQRSAAVQLDVANPRDFASDERKTVDDVPFAGGPGMLMLAETTFQAYQSLSPESGAAVVMTDPTGERFEQRHATELSKKNQVIFVCGHYEGIDERFAQKYGTHRFSIGDYVLTGGELPSLVMADAVIRLLPGVLGDSQSLSIDSHSDGLLSAPQYTRPETWQDIDAPAILRSGDHGAIAKWKREQALRITRDRRPDLFARATLEKGDADMLK